MFLCRLAQEVRDTGYKRRVIKIGGLVFRAEGQKIAEAARIIKTFEPNPFLVLNIVHHIFR